MAKSLMLVIEVNEQPQENDSTLTGSDIRLTDVMYLFYPPSYKITGFTGQTFAFLSGWVACLELHCRVHTADKCCGVKGRSFLHVRHPAVLADAILNNQYYFMVYRDSVNRCRAHSCVNYNKTFAAAQDGMQLSSRPSIVWSRGFHTERVCFRSAPVLNSWAGFNDSFPLFCV